MPHLHLQFMYDHEGSLQSVILNIDEFRSLLECAGIPLEDAVADKGLRMKKLVWMPEELLDARVRMSHLKADWDSDGMEMYDTL